MDQKRALWIIAAAGIFLLVVLGFAIIVYPPVVNGKKNVASTKTTTTTTQTAPAKNTTSSSGWTKDSDTAYTKELTVYSDKTVVYGKEEDSTTIDLNALRAEIEKAQNPQNINITVNVPETKTDIVPPASVLGENKVDVKVPVEKTPVVEEKTPVSTPAKVEVKTETKVDTKPVTVKSTAKTTTTVKTTAAATTAAKPAPKAEPEVTKYWIQAASFSTKKAAESSRAKLDDSKIPADIFTYTDSKGKVWYRVRVGPYTTKSEAEYWKSKIVTISEFKEGYITTK
ncbi:MAG: SPOR domain-containing protein [Treponema sp.]|nr:SPOR domain-containing protein [Treponema sp.]